jgi:hypothetical protein
MWFSPTMTPKLTITTFINKDNPNQSRGRSNFDVTRFWCKQIQEFHRGDWPTNKTTNQWTNQPTDQHTEWVIEALARAYKIGKHPSLLKFLYLLRKENSVIELDWLQRDRPYATKKSNAEDRDKFAKRTQWKNDLRAAIANNSSDEQLFDFLDKMTVINRITRLLPNPRREAFAR